MFSTYNGGTLYTPARQANVLRTFAVSYDRFRQWRRVAARNGWVVENVERHYTSGVVYVVCHA